MRMGRLRGDLHAQVLHVAVPAEDLLCLHVAVHAEELLCLHAAVHAKELLCVYSRLRGAGVANSGSHGGAQHTRRLGSPSSILHSHVAVPQTISSHWCPARRRVRGGQGTQARWGAGAARVARALLDTAALAAACREVERALKLSDRAAMYL